MHNDMQSRVDEAIYVISANLGAMNVDHQTATAAIGAMYRAALSRLLTEHIDRPKLFPAVAAIVNWHINNANINAGFKVQEFVSDSFSKDSFYIDLPDSNYLN